MINESQDYIEEIAENAGKVKATVESPGWRDVIRPALEQRLDSLLKQLLDAEGHENIILIQQGARAISNLMTFIQQTLTDGEEAVQEGRRRMGLSEHP